MDLYTIHSNLENAKQSQCHIHLEKAKNLPTTISMPPPSNFKILHTKKQILPWAQKYFGAWKDSLTRDERYAIYRYADSSFRTLNASLRSGSCIREKDRQLLYHLSNAIKRSTLQEDLLLYRQTDFHALGILSKIHPEDMIGKVIYDKGFVSTSLQEYMALAFTNDPYDCGCGSPCSWIRNLTVQRNVPKYLKNGILMRIRAPKETVGAYIGNLSAKDAEQEVLLYKNQKFKITDVSLSKGKFYIDCDILLP
jgi:hypothetical protein